MMRRILFVAAAALLLLACIREPDRVSYVEPGDALPEFSVLMEDGTVLSAASFAGRVSVLILFNTGCSDCRSTLPVVQSVMEKFPSVHFVAVSREQDAAQVRLYWDANSLSIPFAACPDRSVYSKFASSGIPRVYVCDSRGIVRACWDDSPCPDRESLEKEISSLL